MAEFYIEISPRENGDHIVHDASCGELPAKDTMQYLGSIASCASALKKASERFKQANGCPVCAVSCHATVFV